jgi:hypothetical protein
MSICTYLSVKPEKKKDCKTSLSRKTFKGTIITFLFFLIHLFYNLSVVVCRSSSVWNECLVRACRDTKCLSGNKHTVQSTFAHDTHVHAKIIIDTLNPSLLFHEVRVYDNLGHQNNDRVTDESPSHHSPRKAIYVICPATHNRSSAVPVLMWYVTTKILSQDTVHTKTTKGLHGRTIGILRTKPHLFSWALPRRYFLQVLKTTNLCRSFFFVLPMRMKFLKTWCISHTLMVCWYEEVDN